MKKILMVCSVFVGLVLSFACKGATTPAVKKFPTIESFTVNPTTIHRGDSATLSWSVKDATSVTIDQGVGTVSATTGTKQVNPLDTITYILTATNADGNKTASCTLTVELVLPVITSFTVNPITVIRGNSSTLSWNVSGATTVTIDQGVGTVSATGSSQVSPTATTTYTLTATNNDGNRTASCTLTVEKLLPTINYFLSNPTSIQLGNSSALTWAVQNADTITIDQGVGTVSATGNRQVSPQATTTYTLTATNIDGQTTATCQVEILRAAILTISQVPANPIYSYNSYTNITTSTFSVILTESNNVGGTITDLLIGTFLDDVILSAQDFGSGSFNPLNTLTFPNCVVVATGRPNLVVILALGIDLNGYEIEVGAYAAIVWSTSADAATLELQLINKGDPRFDRVVRETKRHKR